MNLNLFKFAILLIGVICLAIMGFALHQISLGYTEPWATLTAVLAVLASLFSAWTAQRAFEEQEAEKEPYPYPEFDMYSRMGLALLKVVNRGQSTAIDISIEWDTPLLDTLQENVFAPIGGAAIHVLSPNSQVARSLGSVHEFIQEQGESDGVYTGTIKFKNTAGKQFEHPFIISASQYKDSLTFESEQQAAFKDIQKIPVVLKEIKSELLQIRGMANAIGEYGWPLKEALKKQNEDLNTPDPQ